MYLHETKEVGENVDEMTWQLLGSGERKWL
jgi:hypothetical protein